MPPLTWHDASYYTFSSDLTPFPPGWTACCCESYRLKRYSDCGTRTFQKKPEASKTFTCMCVLYCWKLSRKSWWLWWVLLLIVSCRACRCWAWNDHCDSLALNAHVLTARGISALLRRLFCWLLQDFQEILMFLQDMPTAEWGEEEVEPVLSQAYILSTLFDGSPSHLN